MSHAKITISIPYKDILLGLEQMCGLKNVSFGDWGVGPVHEAAAAIPILLSKVFSDPGLSCVGCVDIGSIHETEDSNGNKVLNVDLIPNGGIDPFLKCVVNLQKALSELH
jgi:hypothetical protein